MNKIISFSLLILLGAGSYSFSQTLAPKKEALVWYTDAMKAQELSNSTHKPIFAFFTGSDWCGWCIKLQKNVFETSEFIVWAKKNVILLELDFPRRKQLPPELAQQNASLQQTFQIQGFPTVWMFYLTKDTTSNNYNISALGSLGYPGGEAGKEAETFIGNANKILANKKK